MVDRLYICSTYRQNFMVRYRSHLCSFSNVNYSNATTLASYIQDLKCKRINYFLEWSIILKARVLILVIINANYA